MKSKFQLVASISVINRAVNRLGWRKVQTKYCQIERPYNRLKRFIFSCQAKIEEDETNDVTDVDECRPEMRWFTAKTWKKQLAFIKSNMLKSRQGRQSETQYRS